MKQNLTVQDICLRVAGMPLAVRRAAMKLLLAALLPATAQTAWAWDGEGTYESPYQIKNASDLDQLATNVNSGTGDDAAATGYGGYYFALTNDIEYSHKADGEEGASTENNYTAIGNLDHPFKGYFDGKGHTVSGIRIYKSGRTDADQHQGLFGCINGYAEVKNVTLADARITGYYRIGGIVGWNGSSIVTNCHVLSTVTIGAWVSGAYYLGGIVGENYCGSVFGCTSAASITTTASGCFVFGGVVGLNEGTVSDCLYFGNTIGGFRDVGAIVGDNSSSSTVQNCYYTSTTITGKDGSGGTLDNANSAVGLNAGTVATTVGLARTVAAGTGVTIDAIALTGTATHYDDYHDIITAYSGGGIVYAGKAYCPGGSTVSLTLSYTPQVGYTFNGFTASAGTLSGETNPYTLTMPDDDVTISADITAIPWAGTGSVGDPYVISYPSQLDLLAERVNSGTGDDYAASGYSGNYFQLGDDIAYDPDNLTIDTNNDGTMDSNYKAIGGFYGVNRYFKGHFDGQGHTISGIRIYWNGESSSWDSYKGLFGWIDDAVVENVTLADAHITGNERIGGIVGCIGSYNSDNPGTVSNCHVLRSVTIDAVVLNAWYHGGIVGYNDGGTVSGCTSAASITTTTSTNSRYNGGIAGTNYGSSARVSDCLYLGTTVEGIKRVGAIVGNNYAGQVQNCYFTSTTFQGKDNSGNNLDNAESAVGYNENGGTVAATVGLARTVAAGTSVTIDAIALTGTATDYRTITGMTGDNIITAYSGGGIEYAGKLYYGKDCVLSLTLSYGDAPLGYHYTYSASAGTLSGTDNPYTLTMPDADVTISTDQLITNTYTIAYHENGGTLSTDKNTFTVESSDITLDEPTREYYTFLGWYDNEDLTGAAVTTIAHGSTDNVELWAKWGIPYIDANGDTQYHLGNATILTADIRNLDGGWYVVAKDVSYNDQFSYGTGDIHIILGDGAKMTVTSSKGNAIELDGGCNLTIYAQSTDSKMGQLEVNASDGNGYGISNETGILTINGGSVTVNNEKGSGIYDYDGIIINGGTVTVAATGTYGIYIEDCNMPTNGIYMSSGMIINGGTVTVTGGSYGIYIVQNCLNINGGKVTATATGENGYGIYIGSDHRDSQMYLGWTNASDYIYASSYFLNSYNILLKDGQAFTDGTMVYDENICVIEGNTLRPCLVLADNADNGSMLAGFDGETIAVALKGRTLTKDGTWNTLCLPFDVTLSGSPLDGFTVKELNASASSLDVSGQLTIDFTTVTDKIVAGKPYILKWPSENGAAEDLENPVFPNVTITSTEPEAVTFSNALGAPCQFVGQYSPFEINDGTATEGFHSNVNNIDEILFLATTTATHSTVLGYSQSPRLLRACRAHFYVPAGQGVSAVRSINLNFGDDGEATGIVAQPTLNSQFSVLNSDAWYSMDGRRLPGKPAQKGVYIHQGRKIVVK